MGITIDCKQCGIRLFESSEIRFTDEDRARVLPCRNCGASSVIAAAVHQEGVSFYDQMKYKAKRPGMKRPLAEGKVGSDHHRGTDEWRQLSRHIDRTLRKHDEAWYEEKIVRPNGEVVRDVSEPLRKHQNRGSAKRRKGGDESLNGNA